MNWLNNLVRPEILELAPYSSARSEYKGAAQIQLDANEKPEKPYGQNTDTLNRYPEPQPLLLRQKLADMYAVSTEQLLITRGMDEGIDLLIRLFCLPYKDTITILPPTFRYYEVCAKINAINIIEMPLSADFSPNWADLQKIVNTKLIFLCTPNNPTGNLLTLIDIKKLCDSHAGRALIAVDEAYIEFANTESAITLLPQCENLVVMRTLSKAYGLAGARLGTVITHPNIIVLLQKIIPPYPIPTLCSEAALVSLSPIGLAYTKRKIAEIKQQRAYMAEMLLRSADIQQIYKSEGNFLLLIAKNADSLYQKLKSKGIIVRKRTQDIPNALRITIGTPEENQLLLEALDIVESKNAIIRKASKMRKTKETEILCEVKLDDKGEAHIKTGIGFFDHMLEQLARHSGISMNIQALGDLHIDVHHTVEDVAIVLGQALKEALGDKRGLNRYGFLLPMDEAETKISIDLSGRGHCRFSAEFPSPQVGDFPTEMVKHFFETLSMNLGAAIHIAVNGQNTHHMIEAIFKGVAKALKQTLTITSDQLLSTKGVL